MSEEFDKKKREAFQEFLESKIENISEDDSLEKIIEESKNQVQFDFYAQDTSDWKWLDEFIPGIVIHSAGGICPFQAEGFIKGHPFYYRERGGVASLLVTGEDDSTPYSMADALWGSSEDVDEFRNGPGWISTLINLVEKLEKTPFLYSFSARRIEFEDNNDLNSMYSTDFEDVVYGWGYSPEEALESIQRTSEYLTLNGWSEESQKRYHELQKISSIPLNYDNRGEIPDPDFEIQVPEIWRNSKGLVDIPEDFWKQS